MKMRGRWTGMCRIVRFNWPLYAAAFALLIGGAIVCFASNAAPWRIGGAIAAAGALYFIAGSLGVSHLIYDRSDLYRWRWLGRALGAARRDECIFCHAGFDEASLELREHLGAPRWRVLDHFDAAQMTEPSIRRARRLLPPVAGTLAAPFDRWPTPAASTDVIFGLLAIHELRGEDERTAWFAEAKRCLHPDGRIVLVEHTRDFPNAVAFGPGALHFHSRASWRRCWTRAGLRVSDEFPLTPWLRVFILTPP